MWLRLHGGADAFGNALGDAVVRTIAMQDGATQTKRPCDAPAGSSPSSAENKVRQMVMEKLKGANARDWSKEKIAGYLAEQLETFRASIGENVTDTQPPADMTLRAGDTLAWSSKDMVGWENVHKVALVENLGEYLPRDLLDLVLDANIAVDAKPYQDGRASVLHGMFGVDKNDQPIGTAALTKEQTDQWIKFNYQAAQDILNNNGDPAKALMHYGFASHSLQDTTSPAHNSLDENGKHVFKEWHDHDMASHKTATQDIPHVMIEATYPGAGSNLARATRDLFDIFFMNKEMPKTNIIDNYGIDRKRYPNPVKALFNHG